MTHGPVHDQGSLCLAYCMNQWKIHMQSYYVRDTLLDPIERSLYRAEDGTKSEEESWAGGVTFATLRMKGS